VFGCFDSLALTVIACHRVLRCTQVTKLCDLNEDQAEEGSQQEEQVTSVCWTLSVRT
jgi:hypothetical protein